MANFLNSTTLLANMTIKDLRFRDYHYYLCGKALDLNMRINISNMTYHKTKYLFIKLRSRKTYDNNILITAGFHGNEIAGPLTILDRLEDIVKSGEERNLGLIIFPCINLSGFDFRTRYDMLSDEDGAFNNDFIKYNFNNKIVDDMKSRRKKVDFLYSDDIRLKESSSLPRETKKMHKELRKILKMGWNKISGHIDLHQDCFIDREKTFAYVFDKKQVYLPIIEKTSELVPVWKNAIIDTGYRTKVLYKNNGDSKLLSIENENDKVRSDKYGFVVRHDGSITDLSFQKGVPYVTSIETSYVVPIEKAMDVNMIWIKGIMDLAAEKKSPIIKSSVNASPVVGSSVNASPVVD